MPKDGLMPPKAGSDITGGKCHRESHRGPSPLRGMLPADLTLGPSHSALSSNGGGAPGKEAETLCPVSLTCHATPSVPSPESEALGSLHTWQAREWLHPELLLRWPTWQSGAGGGGVAASPQL